MTEEGKGRMGEERDKERKRGREGKIRKGGEGRNRHDRKGERESLDCLAS